MAGLDKVVSMADGVEPALSQGLAMMAEMVRKCMAGARRKVERFDGREVYHIRFPVLPVRHSLAGLIRPSKGGIQDDQVFYCCCRNRCTFLGSASLCGWTRRRWRRHEPQQCRELICTTSDICSRPSRFYARRRRSICHQRAETRSWSALRRKLRLRSQLLSHVGDARPSYRSLNNRLVCGLKRLVPDGGQCLLDDVTRDGKRSQRRRNAGVCSGHQYRDRGVYTFIGPVTGAVWKNLRKE
jgi:hypothetical protein